MRLEMSTKIKSQTEKQSKRWERLDSIIDREYSVSNMSNSKWVKLLKGLCSYQNIICGVNFKLVYSDYVQETNIEQYEEHVDEYWFREPIIYKEIEWLELLTTSHLGNETLKMAINAIAQFQMQTTEKSIRVIGYGKA